MSDLDDLPDLNELAAGRVPSRRITHADWLRAFLRRRTEGLGLIDLHVSATAHTRWDDNTPVWVPLTSVVSEAERAEVMTSVTASHAPVILNGKVVRCVPVGPPGSKAELPLPGRLLSFHYDLVSAGAADARLASLANDVALAVRLLRTARDREAMSRWPSLLAALGRDRADRLRDLAGVVQRRMRADGAKIYLLRRAPHGGDLHLAARSDLDGRPADPYALSDEVGMADHVIRTNAWLLIPEALPENERGIKPEQGQGPSGPVPCLPRRDEDVGPDHGRDDESSMLLVPMRLDGRAVGAVYVWRRVDESGRHDPPFEARFDRAHLEAFAEQLALAGLGWVQSDVAELEARHLAQLGAPATTPHELHGRLATAVGELSRAAGCVLMLRDEGSLEGECYYSAATWWRAGGPSLALVTQARSSDGDVRAAVTEGLVAIGTPRSPSVRDVHIWPDPRGDRPAGWFVTLSAAWPDEKGTWPPSVPAEHNAYRPFDDAVLARALPQLLSRLTPALVDGLEHARLRSAEPADSRRSEGSAEERLRMTIRRALERVRTHTGADAALYYRIEGGRPRVADCVPDGTRALEHTPGPRTTQVLHEARPVRQILQPSSQGSATRPSPLAQSLGWEPAALQSWLCVPVGEARSAWGLFKLVTRPGGPLLGAAHERVASQVAAQVARLADHLRHEMMIETLNEHATRWAGHPVGGLAQPMKNDLDRWLKIWVHPEAGVALVFSMGGQRPEIFLRAGIESPTDEDLIRATEAHIGKHDWRRSRIWRLSGRDLWAQAIGAQGQPGMRGYLAVSSPTPLTAAQREVVREAAREVANALDRVDYWHQWQRDRSIFRHAILAPVQGLRSAALELVELAREAGATAASVSTMETRVLRESSALQLWRDNERFHLDASGSVSELHPRRIQVGEMVRACEERFRPLLVGRAQRLRTTWQMPKDSVVLCDSDLVELALANLLDNAHKYAFAATEIVLGIAREHGVLRIWVEDEGNGIEVADHQAIYQVGRRATRDPVRNIDGSGLGLPIARAIARAHNGDVRHKATPLRQIRQREPVRVHRVRFTMTLEA